MNKRTCSLAKTTSIKENSIYLNLIIVFSTSHILSAFLQNATPNLVGYLTPIWSEVSLFQVYYTIVFTILNQYAHDIIGSL